MRYSYGMIIAAGLFWSAVALELLVYLITRRWESLRTALAYIALATGLLAAGALVIVRLDTFSMLLLLFSLYRGVNMLRVTKQRMHEPYLNSAARRSGIILIGLQGLVFVAWAAWLEWHVAGHTVWGTFGIVQAIVAGLLLLSTIRTIKRTAWPTVQGTYSDHDLPSVTVAIPARNETEDLRQCLVSVIASDYPKLEVIVLDDCSQIRQTPEIIRQFAQDGVRFIQGKEPQTNWLPKNQAYARLAEEASGAYIVFCGVDVRFSSGSIRSLVATMLDRKKQMISILPLRRRSVPDKPSLIQAMRYWWELALPRRMLNRPPVLSSCWIVHSTSLEEAGGFASVKRAIVPEAHFAKCFVKADTYSFLRSNERLGIESGKLDRDQKETAVRMRYPQLHRRPEQVAITTLLELALFVLPFVLAISSFWISIGSVAQAAAIVACLLLIAVYKIVVLNTRVNAGWFGLVAPPFAILTDIVLLHYSMWKYEFSNVEWKGRNICIPVMHAEERSILRKQ